MGLTVRYKLLFIMSEAWSHFCNSDVEQFEVREAPYEEVLELQKDVDFYNETRLDGEPSAHLFVDGTISDIRRLMTETRARRLRAARDNTEGQRKFNSYQEFRAYVEGELPRGTPSKETEQDDFVIPKTKETPV